MYLLDKTNIFMIVEYFGIPGCGKTYQANIYKKELKRQGLSYIDLSRWKGMPLWLKIFYKFLDISLILLPKYRKLYNQFHLLCKDSYDKKPAYLPFSVDYCIGRIVCSIFLQDVFSRSKKILINDEGLMQWVVFFNIQYNISTDSILSILEPLNKNCRTIFIDTTINAAFENIKKRNRHVCEMDKMEDSQLMKYLIEYDKVCKVICEKGYFFDYLDEAKLI